MLTRQDDFLGHQTPTTFDHPATSDRDWMERYWYAGWSTPDGRLVFDIGFGLHTNRNVMDGYATFAIDGKQYNARFSRRARPDPLTSEIGPFKIQVVESMRTHRLVLEPNGSSLTFDLTFSAATVPHEEEHHFRRRNGRVTEDMERFVQGGRWSGWIKVGDRTVTIDPNQWMGARDHSWGVRAEFNTDETRPPLTAFPPFFYHWTQILFEDRTLHLYLNDRAPGSVIYFSGEEAFSIGATRKSRRLASMTHNIVWARDPLGQAWDNGTFEILFRDGERRTLTFRALPGRAYLKGGLYGGLNGWSHGDDKGPFHAEHEVWDLQDPATRRLARTISSHVLEVHDEGRIGYGISQYGVTQGYPNYKEPQAFPAP